MDRDRVGLERASANDVESQARLIAHRLRAGEVERDWVALLARWRYEPAMRTFPAEVEPITIEDLFNYDPWFAWAFVARVSLLCVGELRSTVYKTSAVGPSWNMVSDAIRSDRVRRLDDELIGIFQEHRRGHCRYRPYEVVIHSQLAARPVEYQTDGRNVPFYLPTLDSLPCECSPHCGLDVLPGGGRALELEVPRWAPMERVVVNCLERLRWHRRIGDGQDGAALEQRGRLKREMWAKVRASLRGRLVREVLGG